jgi:hypothetical protein
MMSESGNGKRERENEEAKEEKGDRSIFGPLTRK